MLTVLHFPIYDSKGASNSEQWVPAKRSLGRPQVVLARPPRATGGYRQFFGFPITRDEVEYLGTMCFNQLRPGEKRDRMFIYQNSSNFIQRSLCLPFCVVTCGLADGESDIPSECIIDPTAVRLLIVWRDRDDDDDCPTP
ncbi:hypothetical protein K503DRAFT_777435, partial [Rhizopogon vinicolor AM-OR11-026]